jgi:hypothetical protein
MDHPSAATVDIKTTLGLRVRARSAGSAFSQIAIKPAHLISKMNSFPE